MTAIVCKRTKGEPRIDLRVCAAKCKHKCGAYWMATDKQGKLFEMNSKEK